MREVRLTKGYVTLVDDENYERLLKYSWHAHISHGHVSARANIGTNDLRNDVYMHRFLLGVSDNTIQVDHKDGNPLNNQKSNLRIATNRQNSMNKKKPFFKDSENKQSKYKGVSWYKPYSKWLVRLANKHVGYFESEKDAAIAYNEAAKVSFGEFAKLNDLEI